MRRWRIEYGLTDKYQAVHTVESEESAREYYEKVKAKHDGELWFINLWVEELMESDSSIRPPKVD